MKSKYNANLIIEAKRLREEGFSYQVIADKIGVSSGGTVHYWLNKELCNETSKRYYDKNKDEINATIKDRYANDLEYRTMVNDRRKEYHEVHRDSDNARSTQWHNDHKNDPEFIAKQKEYYELNRERKCEYSSQWYLDNEEKAKATAKKYREDNAEMLKEKSRVSYWKNRDATLEKAHAERDVEKAEFDAYCEEHEEEFRLCYEYIEEQREIDLKEYRRNYKLNNKERTNEDTRRRRAMMQTIEKIDEDQYDAIFDEQEGLCFYCGEQMLRDGDHYNEKYYNVDHLNPIANGGFHALSNVLYACRKCNGSKNDTLVEKWMPSIMDKIYAHPRLEYNIEENQKRWLI